MFIYAVSFPIKSASAMTVEAKCWIISLRLNFITIVTCWTQEISTFNNTSFAGLTWL